MLRRNIILLKYHNFFNGLWLFAALAVIYFQQVTGSYSLAMLAFSFVNLSQSLAEIPCGMFSDRINRKATLVLGSICVFINMVLWALAGVWSSTWLLFLGSVFRGVGLAFKSGTDSALLYETLKDSRRCRLYLLFSAKTCSFYHVGALVAAFLATIITYYFSLQTLVWMAIIPYFANIFINYFMINPKNCFEKGMSPQKHLQKSLTTFVKNKKLRKYAILQMTNHALSVSVFRFESGYFEALIPVYLVNIARALQHATGWVGYFLVNLFEKSNLIKILCYSTLGSALVKITGLIMNNSIAPFFMSLQNLFYGPAQSASSTLLQKEYKSGLRATLESIISLGEGIATAIIGFLIGLVADIFSPRIILFVATFCSIAIAIAYRRLFKPVIIKK